MSNLSVNNRTHLEPHGSEQLANGRELLQYCKQELAAYKVPTLLEFRQSLPKSLIGKVIRRELRAAVEPREG